MSGLRLARNEGRLRRSRGPQGCNLRDSFSEIALVGHKVSVEHRARAPAREPHRDLLRDAILDEAPASGSAEVVRDAPEEMWPHDDCLPITLDGFALAVLQY